MGRSTSGWKPPRGLSEDGRRFWRDIASNFRLTEESYELLRVAAFARDRADRARELLAKEGLTVKARSGVPRAHPAAKILTEAEAVFVRALSALGLEA